MTDNSAKVAEPSTPMIRASLELSNLRGSPNDVSRLLGIEPTRSGEAGDAYVTVRGAPTEKRIQESFWSLWSAASRGASLEQHLGNILDQVEAVGERLNELPLGTTITIVCTVIPEGPLPLLRFDADLLRRLAQLGADMTLDVVSVRRD